MRTNAENIGCNEISSEMMELSEIKQLEEPIYNILIQIGNKIEKGEYTSLIGDDASGRIPTLIFRDIINTIYKTKNLEPLKAFFIAASFNFQSDEEYKKYEDIWQHRFALLGDYIGSNPLIVTDWISSGYTIERLQKYLYKYALKSTDYKEMFCDIAALGIGDEFRYYDQIQYYKNKKMIYHWRDHTDGNIFDGGLKEEPRIFQSYGLSAIQPKRMSKDSISKKVDEKWACGTDANAQALAAIKDKMHIKARKESRMLADKIASRYFERFR